MAENPTLTTEYPQTSSTTCSEVSSTQSTISLKRQEYENIQNILQQDVVDLTILKKFNWQGVDCPSTRAQIWRLILGYESSSKKSRSEELRSKRLEYLNRLQQLQTSSRTVKAIKSLHKSLLKYDLFKTELVKNSLTSLVTLLSKDENLGKKFSATLIVPLFVVFLSEFYPLDLETLQVHDEGPQKAYLNIVEADTYWCSITFLNFYYIKKKSKLHKGVVKALEKFDSAVLAHMNIEGINLAFVNRWVKHLFLKDFPLHICVRIFDELISNSGLRSVLENRNELHNSFIVCLACALITIFRGQILMVSGTGLENLMMRLPTETWGEIEILILVSQAYLYQSILE